MPTVMLTTHCPNACPWCFSRQKMEEYRARGIREMSWDDFVTVVDFYERSGLLRMVLLGGEPAWHSRFMDILRYLRERAFSVLVLTTGILPERLVGQIASEHLPNLQFAVNTTSFFRYGDSKKRRVSDFLHRMGRVTSIAYTITERDTVEKKIEPILDRIAMIMKFGLIRRLQFQLAVPGEGNRLFIPFDRYRDAAELVRGWFDVLKKNDIDCGLDCHCMPACAMPPHQQGSDLFGSRCDCFMVDIGPGLEAWPCFPLSGQMARLAGFESLDGIYRHFAGMNRASGIVYDERCHGCAERASSACHGGCRGFQHLRANSGMTRQSGIPSFQLPVRRAAPCA